MYILIIFYVYYFTILFAYKFCITNNLFIMFFNFKFLIKFKNYNQLSFFILTSKKNVYKMINIIAYILMIYKIGIENILKISIIRI